jgi:hypothetical protein
MDILPSAATLPLALSPTITPVAVPAGWSAAARPAIAPVDYAHAWLNDTMPTESRNRLAATGPAGRNEFGVNPGEIFGARVRYEPGPTDLLASMSLSMSNPGTNPYEQAVRRADQLMLSTSNFVPHCVDFIVDWSFGKTYETGPKAGEVIWHSLPSPGNIYSANNYKHEPLPYPYVYEAVNNRFEHELLVSPGTPPAPPDWHTVTNRLIYGVDPVDTAASPPECWVSELTSYFGWTDPTYVVPMAGVNPVPRPDSNTAGVIPWAWPKLVRVTVVLADPLDPTIESTFQYVFSVPDAPGPKAQ